MFRVNQNMNPVKRCHLTSFETTPQVSPVFYVFALLLFKAKSRRYQFDKEHQMNRPPTLVSKR